MDVCEDCHERDLQVTQCKEPLSKHVQWHVCSFNRCDICGRKSDTTYYCGAYGWYISYTEVMKGSQIGGG